MIEQPVFLVGSERSGTTLLRLMLDHHPALAFHFEFDFAVSQVSDDGGLPPLAAYRAWLRHQMAFLESQPTVDPGLAYPELVDSFLAQKRDRDRKSRVGATIHKHFDRALHIWPDARFIKLVRDGRDVSRSSLEMGWAANMWFAADRWVDAELLWQNLRPRLSPDAWVEVRYEDLIREPSETLERICAFMGLTYDEAMFGYVGKTSYGRPDPSLIEQWRSRLSDDEIRLAEARIGSLLVELGYKLSGLPELVVSDAKRASLARHNRWGKRRFRLKRLGLPLMLADIITRNLPIQALRTPVVDRLIAVERKYIK